MGYAVSTVPTESVTSTLSGKVSGVAIDGTSKKIVIRGASSIKEGLKDNEPRSGLLTAGEINDIEEWSEWLQVLNKNEYKKIQKDWCFYLENKIDVTIKDANNKPLNNIKVVLYDDINNPIMIARTDATGEVTLFKDLHDINKSDFYLVQASHEGQTVGKKIVGNYSKKVALTLENYNTCLLYTSPSPRDKRQSRMPSSA